MTSSWSWPQEFCPFLSSTPITVNGIFLMRIDCPTGSDPWKSCSATVCPMTATLATPRTAESLKPVPLTIAQRRMAKMLSLPP